MNSGANCLYISLYEVPCTNGGQHGVGESCKQYTRYSFIKVCIGRLETTRLSEAYYSF